jgi:hypothetical protein
MVGAKWTRALFIVVTVYDAVLGLAFLVAARAIFEMFEVTPPNHMAYVQFPGLLLLLFAGMYATIAVDPARYRILIPFGAGLKVAYAGIVFFYSATSGIPSMWLPWAWADLLFLVFFIFAWRATGRLQAQRLERG